jgi:hypothetical protein
MKHFIRFLVLLLLSSCLRIEINANESISKLRESILFVINQLLNIELKMFNSKWNENVQQIK